MYCVVCIYKSTIMMLPGFERYTIKPTKKVVIEKGIEAAKNRKKKQN